MPDIVPRWEWRTFDENSAILKEILKDHQPKTQTTGEEIYFLVPREDLNVKIRYNLLDVKQKRMTHTEGMEQWLPIFKCEFPISANPLAEFASILKLNIASNGQALDESLFKQTLLKKQDIVSVSLVKARSKYDLDGVQAEFTALNIKGSMLYTFAMEHIDAERISIFREKLKIGHLSNENYPQALKRWLAHDEGDA